jgi:hypothetical protein
MNFRSLICAWSWCVCVGALPVGNVHAQVYDLAAAWSDVNNPNGAWALYEAPGDLFDVSQPDWYGNGTNQPAWADAPGPDPFPPNPLVPMWAKAVGDVGTLSGESAYNGFVDAGTVFMHAAEAFRTGTDFSSVVWTSPRDGTIHIRGGVWMAQAFSDRPHAWELRKNGVAFTGGPLTYGDGYDKTNPFPFSTGTGGASAVDMAVAQNDQIELLIYKNGSFFTPATFVATDLNIELVPEPGATVLFIGFPLLALFFGRSRR